MSTPTLELRLKAFRLPSFLAHYAPLADQAVQGGWSHVHYLDELAAVEAVERAERRIARLPTVAAVLGHAHRPLHHRDRRRGPRARRAHVGLSTVPPHSAARPDV